MTMNWKSDGESYGKIIFSIVLNLKKVDIQKFLN
jgi:hypothetical protein